MAPPITRRAPPPDSPDTRNRVSKQKSVTNKSNNTSKPTRSTPFSDDTRPKAEALERVLGISQHNDNETPEINDIQMEDTLEDSSLPTANAPSIDSIPNTNLTVATDLTSGTHENFYLASLDLDNLGPVGQFPNEELTYDDFPLLPGKINETLLNTTEAATQRITEARSIFGPIASLLDGQCLLEIMSVY